MLAWLALAFFSDLGLAGPTGRPAPGALLGLLLANPLVFSWAIYSLRHADTLGAVGQFALYRFGDGLPLLLVAVLTGWAAAAFVTAYALFSRRVDA
jgi:hypothetical protein